MKTKNLVYILPTYNMGEKNLLRMVIPVCKVIKN